jgi:hypothetical protein
VLGTLGAGNTTITGTLGAGNTTINGSVTAGLGFFQNTVVKSAAANTIVVIDAPTTGKLSEIDFASNAAIKWTIGRDVDDSFYIYDNIAALERLAISNTGDITVVGNTTITGTVVSRQIYSQSVGASNELNIDTGATGGHCGNKFQ